MGLDMYLNGVRFFMPGNRPAHEHKQPPVKAETYELGYWRKHPNLHGYIVQTFADGVDDCQEIPLDADRLLQVIAAVKARELPFTTGFFFGESEGTDEEMNEDLTILQAALQWLREDDEQAWRRVYYEASW